MNLAQMKTLLPMVEESAATRPPGWGPPHIDESEPVLDDLTLFSFQDGRSARFKKVVLDSRGNVVREYARSQ